eukprot:CAMPEP_0202108850 /NCGR_PEP_ID=MMETSP0965-20130614/22198_1 /ASSEMBLY_ACC=CAM_ASM_000507 /TAXON_ID=4773 /ORGANISM="Schizochytrium aggregatum, Strain ATCC28209" /LENGTH=50 /DNA_ID=CAMNT_0048678139 /DNA_START=278 /DNA_END=430 /DNA_ORIENTATION=-
MAWNATCTTYSSHLSRARIETDMTHWLEALSTTAVSDLRARMSGRLLRRQ